MVYLTKHYHRILILFIYTNNEQALGKAFKDIYTKKGIISEYTAPYTPAQNSKTEHFRGVITTKARCMRIALNLLYNL